MELKKKEPLSYHSIPFSCILGDTAIGTNVYECRIFDYENSKLERVLVHAKNFGDVQWAMIGYTRKSLIISNTSKSNVKHLVMPNDIGGQGYMIIVLRNR